MTPFDHTPRTRLVFGAGSFSQLGTLATELGARHVLLVTDPGIVKAGYADQAQTLLKSAGLAVTVFDTVRENPTTDDVDLCRDVAHDADIDFLIGLGGGSSLDTAKGVNFLLTNGGTMHDYWGSHKAAKPMLPMIAVPTTAGTGSDVQSYALISDAKTHAKMACGDPKAAPKISLLDPELTLTLPTSVTAISGIDAIVHAVETAVTTKRNPLSLMYSHQAFHLLLPNFTHVLEHSDAIEARGAMLLGSTLAGLAIENSMLGAAHSCANPLTAQFDTIHGIAVGIMLPHVMRFNREFPEIAEAYLGLTGGDDLSQTIFSMLTYAKLPTRLSECGVTEAAIPALAEGAMKQWTAQFNPRPLTLEDFQNLYRAAL